MKNQRLIEVKNIYNETNQRIVSNPEEWKSSLEYYSKIVNMNITMLY